MDKAKLTKVYFINMIWVFLYTAQKQEIKYQKNSINMKLKIKNKANLTFRHIFIVFDLF